MSFISQNVRSSDGRLLSDIQALAPANSSLTGSGPPQPEDGKNGDLYYADDGQIYKKVNYVWETLYSIPGSSASGNQAINNIANVGTAGIGVFKNKVDNNAFFKNLVASTNITLNEVGDDIYISSNDTGAVINDAVISATEAWSSQKINNEITSLPDQKDVLAGSNKISVVEGLTDYTIDLVNSNVDILSLANAPISNVVGVNDVQTITNKIAYRSDIGTPVTPSHSFSSIQNAGMYYEPATSSVNISTLAQERLSVGSAGVNSTVQVRGQGTGALPALSFSNKTNSGVQNQADDVNIIANGQVVGEFKVGEIHAPVNVQFSSEGGSASFPDYCLEQTNMGMFRPGVNQLGFSVDGQSKLEIDQTTIKPLLPLQTARGTAGAPIFHSVEASDSGLYFSAAGQLRVSESGDEKQRWANNETVHSQKVRFSNGDSSNLSIAWSNSGADGFYYTTAGVNTLFLTMNSTNSFFNQNEVGFGCNICVRPGSDNTISSGLSTRRWTSIFATNGTIQTSDARYKQDVKNLQLGTDFIKKLNPVSFVWKPTINKEDPNIAGSKDLPDIIHTRFHNGLLAQQVEQAIKDCGMTLNDTDIIDNDYLIDETKEDRYSIRYHALIPVLIKTIQELEERIQILENK